jgi:arylformamidase
MSTIWLSHIIDSGTPLYGGIQDINIQPIQSQRDGDSCNTSLLRLTSHTGTHVDAPRHFLADGKSIADYGPSSWIFTCPKVLDIAVAPGHLITVSDMENFVKDDENTDILLLRTGFEQYRREQTYWQQGPGLSADLSLFFKSAYPSLRAVGIDFISISSFQHREEGRRAHKMFLGEDILLIEDMALHRIEKPDNLYHIIALPLRFDGADGAPCTILGWVKDGA